MEEDNLSHDPQFTAKVPNIGPKRGDPYGDKYKWSITAIKSIYFSAQKVT